MTKTSLLLQLLVCLACWIAINQAIKIKSWGLPSRQHLLKVEAINHHAILLCGNSLMAVAGDTEGMEEILKRKVANIALGATNPVEHLMILEHAKPSNPIVVVYGFFDLQLSDNTTATWREIVGNRTVGLVANPAAAIDLYCKDAPQNRPGLLFASYLPTIQDRLSVWSRVELMRRNLEEIGLQKSNTNRFGRVHDFTLLESRQSEETEYALSAAVSRQPVWNTAVEQLLEDTKKSSSLLVFVRMPMPSRHRANLYSTASYQRYFDRICSDATARGVKVIDASDWISDSAFADSIHANAAGASVFSSKLATVLRSYSL